MHPWGNVFHETDNTFEDESNIIGYFHEHLFARASTTIESMVKRGVGPECNDVIEFFDRGYSVCGDSRVPIVRGAIRTLVTRNERDGVVGVNAGRFATKK